MHRKTRPQILETGQRDGFFHAMKIFLPGVLASMFMLPSCADAAPPPAPPAVTAQTQKAALVAQLAKVKNPTEAALIRDQLEGLRTKTIRPATMLLVRRATRELGEEKPGDAIEDFGAALSLQNDVAVLWRLRAQARLAGGDTTGAISDLGVALQHDGDDAVSWQTLATVEDVAGDDQAALKAWQRVMELDPQLPGAGKMLEKLRLKAFGRPT